MALYMAFLERKGKTNSLWTQIYKTLQWPKALAIAAHVNMRVRISGAQTTATEAGS